MRRPLLRASRTARSLLALGCIGVLAAFFAGSAWAPPSSKFFSATRIAPSSGNIPAGDISQVTIRIANCNATLCDSAHVSSQNLGSANINFPSPGPFTPQVPASVVAPSGKTWNAMIAGNTVRLRTPRSSDALAPGEFVTVTVDVTVPASAACTFPTGSPYVIDTEARQSNDFSGKLNSFTNVPPQPTLGVSPGALDHFVVGAISTPKTAGDVITVSATAYDACGIVKTNYGGGAAIVQDLLSSPDGTPPTYTTFEPWSAGSSTATVTPTAASTFSFDSGTQTATYNADVRITVRDGGVGGPSGQSNFFAVVPDDAAAMTLTQPPTRSFINSNINAALGGVKVEVEDAYGNLKPGAFVRIELEDDPSGSAFLNGTKTRTADANGIATFLDLQITQPGLGYTLIAKSPPEPNETASIESSPFLVLTTDETCPASPPCTGQVSIADESTLDVSATGYNETGSTLGLALLRNYTIPDPELIDLCDGFTAAPGLPGAYADVTTGTGGTYAPSLTVTLTIDQIIVDAQPNSGASQWDICLGAVNLNDPDGSSVTGWTQKDGSLADGVFDPVLNATLFWGVLPDVTGGTGSCAEWATVPGAGPAVLSRNKVNGDVIVVFCVPFPWDPQGIAG